MSKSPAAGVPAPPRPLVGAGSQLRREHASVAGLARQLGTSWRTLWAELLVLHQFRLSMIGDEAALDTIRDELALLIHAYGQGARPLREATWAAATTAAPPRVAFRVEAFTTRTPRPPAPPTPPAGCPSLS